MNYNNEIFNINPDIIENEPEMPILSSLGYLLNMTVFTLCAFYPELHNEIQVQKLTSSAIHAHKILDASYNLQNLLHEYQFVLIEEKNKFSSISFNSDIPF